MAEGRAHCGPAQESAAKRFSIHCFAADLTYIVLNNMNNATPTAGPNMVARTNITNDLATITLIPRYER